MAVEAVWHGFKFKQTNKRKWEETVVPVWKHTIVQVVIGVLFLF